jgi:hypothetical protein
MKVKTSPPRKRVHVPGELDSRFRGNDVTLKGSPLMPVILSPPFLLADEESPQFAGLAAMRRLRDCGVVGCSAVDAEEGAHT